MAKITASASVLLVAAVWLASSGSQLRAAELVVRPQPASGVYEVGEPIVWDVQWTGNESPSDIRYTIKRGGRTTVESGKLELVDGRAELKTSLDAPGTLLATVRATGPDGKRITANGGAIVAPTKIEPSAPPPEDFDAFWDAKLKELAAVPMNVKLEQEDSGRSGVDYWQVTIDNIRGRKIHGQLARPAGGEDPDKKYPALFIPQWAGVYPLEKPWVTDRAAEGWLVLNTSAHDLPIDEPREFYQQQFAGPLKNYWAIGNDDPNESYFLPMYLSCVRAVEYLTERPDWNGKSLVVSGTSQGGQQTLVTAALDPRVTAAMALVPAGCDMLGPEIGRTGGWPQWYDQTAGKKDAARVHEASRYFDVVNFAPRIECPVLVGFGLIDEVCPPAGIMAAVNQIDGRKKVIILPASQHQEIDGSQRPYYDRSYGTWLPALRAGKPAPVEAN